MALAVPHVGGSIATGSGTITSDSWTSTAGSLIVAIIFSFGMTSPAAAGDITDSKSNSYALRVSSVGGISGVAIAVYDNVGGTRGATHTVTANPVNSSSGDFDNIGIIEITGADASTPYDATTGAVATDSVTPFAVTAAGAISGNQIAIYGISADLVSNSAWTGPSGYTLIIQNPDPTTDFPCWSGYKINETGTPTVSSTNASSLTGAGAREALVTYKEGAAVTAIPRGRIIVSRVAAQQAASW